MFLSASREVVKRAYKKAGKPMHTFRIEFLLTDDQIWFMWQELMELWS
jgi:hypothetical protein